MTRNQIIILISNNIFFNLASDFPCMYNKFEQRQVSCLQTENIFLQCYSSDTPYTYPLPASCIN